VATLPNHDYFSVPFAADFDGGFYENSLCICARGDCDGRVRGLGGGLESSRQGTESAWYILARRNIEYHMTPTSNIEGKIQSSE
jgi:hypothetical protein